MSLTLTAVALVTMASLIFLYLGIEAISTAGSRHRELFTNHTDARLSEMFIFIDPKKLYVLTGVVLTVSFFATWLLSGSLGMGLAVSLVLANAPKFALTKLKQRRQYEFLFSLPDTLTAMATMMRAGATLNMALDTIVVESKGPIAQEFGLLQKEMLVGIPLNTALNNLHERMPLTELELVIAGIKINREVGGSLAEVFGRLSDTLRRKIEMEGKIKALTAQGKAQGYVMTGLPILLALVLMKMEPEAMSRLFTDVLGWVTCIIFLVFLVIGYKFIQKIVNIDV